MYYVAASRELAYEIKERIYHNQYKIVTPVKKPLYSTAIFRGNFPILSVHSDKNVTVKDSYTMETLDYYYKVNNKWAHVSRVADVGSAPAPKHVTQQLPYNSHICPTNSTRNRGRQGMLLSNAIELGSFYHRLVPKSTNTWSQVTLKHQMICEAKVAGLMLPTIQYNIHIFSYNTESSQQLDIKPFFDGLNSPTYLRRVLSKYFCITPALSDLPEPNKGTVHKKFFSLQRCAYLSQAMAESKQCDGLQLFHSIQTALRKEGFCLKNLGTYLKSI